MGTTPEIWLIFPVKTLVLEKLAIVKKIVKTSLFSIACRVSHSDRRQTAIFDLLVILISLVLVTATGKLNAILLENPLAWILIFLRTTSWPVEEKYRLSYTQESLALRMAWKNNKALYSKSRNVCKGKHDALNLSYYPTLRAVSLR